MRGEQNNILFPVRISWAYHYSWGGAPNPALLFSLQKSKQKASTPGSHKIYFYPGILQLPTVKQIKRLYNSVQNRFYKQVQKGAFNGEQQRQQRRTASGERQRQNNNGTQQNGNGKTATAKQQKQTEKAGKYTLFNLLARQGKIKISKNQ